MKLERRRGERWEYVEPGDGKKFFSVSQIRKVAHAPYVGIPVDVLEAARVRGVALHARFTRALAARVGLCETPLVIPEYRGYCQSMDHWIMMREPNPIRFEEIGYSLRYGYAGTPDALVRFGQSKRLTLLDLKTGAPSVTDAMQLVAYHWMEGYDEAVDLLDLYIQADGSPAVEKPVTKAQQGGEWAWFMAALGVLQGRINHGVQ